MTDKVYLKFDPETVTFDDMIALQESTGATLREQKEMLVAFVVDQDGRRLPTDEAAALLGKFTVTQLKEAFAAFQGEIQEAMTGTLPNGQGPQ